MLLPALAAAFAAPGWAQFQLLVTQGDTAFTATSGSSVQFTAPVGSSVAATVRATYTGTGQATFDRQPLLLGSTAFSASLSQTLPLTLTPGSSLVFEVRYRPSNAAQASAQLNLSYVETTPATVPGNPPATTSGAILLGLVGTAPAFTLSYLLQTDQNVIPLAPGAPLLFPPTPVNTVAQAALSVTNTGSGQGNVTGIVLVSGTAFRLARLPLFPQTVPPAQTLQVLVLYQPSGVAGDVGQVRITFDSGPPVLIELQGSGTAPNFTYQLIDADPPASVAPGGAIELPAVSLGQSSTVLVRVTNTGNQAGTIGSLAVAGASFTVVNAPVLPQTLAPNASLTFGLSFTPSRPGAATGSLFVNADRFPLSGVGLGPELTFSYAAAGSVVTINAANPAVVFPPVRLTESARVRLNVRNTGTQTAVVSNIGPGTAGGPFFVTGIPPLPVSLAPNTEFGLDLTFTPVALGFTTGTLRLDNTVIPLVGSATEAPALPAYTINLPASPVTPGQIPISLTLASPYPAALTGTLTVSYSGDLPVDPALQFAVGGLTARFTIPANTTRAVFGITGNETRLQTGTVAGTLTFTPSFATEAGGVTLSPATPASRQLTIAAARPTLQTIQLTGQTANSFTITVAGFSTTRSLTALNVEFTPAPGVQLSTTRFTVNLQSAAQAYFQSAASLAFGGQFTVSVPFTFQGTGPGGRPAVNSVASVSVTASNDLGASNALQVAVP
jgi:hypothetical protein